MVSRDKGIEESIHSVSVESDELYEVTDADPVYLAKSKLISQAIDEIGFGRYQYGLFFVAGFGWFADNAWPIATSLILTRLNEVDGVHHPPNRAPLLTLAQNLGLLAGAMVWSLSSDIIGRRWAFSLTFLITGVFATISGAAPNFAAIGVFCSFWSFGVGGNLPVDSALFLEVLPSSKKWLLTVMSAWWAIGQVVVTLVSWGLIANYSCNNDDPVCHKKDNQGWRYFLYTMGGMTLLMFLSRFLFRVSESPRFYIGKGEDERAIETVYKIAKYNRTETSITIEDLQRIDELYGDGTHPVKENHLLKEKLKKFDLSHIRACFGSRKLMISSSLVIWTWGIIGLAFPLYNAFLPYYIESRSSPSETEPLSVHTTYRNTLIVAVLGVPGAIIAGLLVELRIGRKGTLIGSLLLTGIILFCSTTSRTANSNLAWNCLFSFFSNIMYGVFYAYTPEVFYSKIRGTEVGFASSFNRILGVFAPIIAMYADLTTSAPIFVSGALFLLSGVLVFFFPYEPRGKSSY